MTTPRILLAGAMGCIFLTVAAAQEQGGEQNRQTTRDNRGMTSSQRFLDLTAISGAEVYRDSGSGMGGDRGQTGQTGQKGEAGQAGQAGQSGRSAQGGSGQKIGTIIDVMVQTPKSSDKSNTGMGERGGADTQGRSGQESGQSGRSTGGSSTGGSSMGQQGKAMAIVALSTGSDTGGGEFGGGRGGATTLSKVQVPLSDLKWDATQRRFTCSKSPESLQRWEEETDKTGGGMNRGEEHGGEPGGREQQNRAGAGNEPMHESKAAKGQHVSAMRVSMAEVEMQGGESARVSGLVFDVQNGTLDYLLIGGEGGAGAVEASGRRSGGGTEREGGAAGGAAGGMAGGSTGGDQIVLPWKVVSIDAGAADGAMAAAALKLSVPFGKDKLQEAPKVGETDKDKFEQQSFRSQIDQFFSQMK